MPRPPSLNSKPNIQAFTRPSVFWESNPTNIKFPVFRGNTAITLITQKTLRDPILPMSHCCWYVGFFVSVKLSVS